MHPYAEKIEKKIQELLVHHGLDENLFKAKRAILYSDMTNLDMTDPCNDQYARTIAIQRTEFNSDGRKGEIMIFWDGSDGIKNCLEITTEAIKSERYKSAFWIEPID